MEETDGRTANGKIEWYDTCHIKYVPLYSLGWYFDSVLCVLIEIDT